MQLYIGNKNYSSWSLRAWLLLRQAGIAFTERQLRLDWTLDSQFKRTLLAIAPSGRVPLLVDDDGFAVWDSLAIAETIAELHPEKRLWPVDRRQRARARSLCAEMHSGFTALRNRCPMNIEASLPEVGRRVATEWPDVADDLRRIDAMWSEQLEASGGPFLFGEFGIVDAYYAPVCSRVRSYALPLGAAALAYVERIHALPAMREWCAAARDEHDFIEDDEPYRQRV
ncbi:MAG TPA: glutathione S-transferase family protein [Burkholderiaceae bacterium]|jgi:glutathione S-transferase|nr:glutathione S-transferase family protein [Burkholderiaceae bacterium]